MHSRDARKVGRPGSLHCNVIGGDVRLGSLTALNLFVASFQTLKKWVLQCFAASPLESRIHTTVASFFLLSGDSEVVQISSLCCRCEVCSFGIMASIVTTVLLENELVSERGVVFSRRVFFLADLTCPQYVTISITVI